MISAFFKILSVAILLTGLLAIMVIKNISAEKQKYINELELTLREEQKINELYKIEWDHLVSPMNIKKISEMIITNDYEKYFVVLDNEDIEQNNELNGTKNIALLFEEFQYDLISELEKFWKQKNIILPQSDFAFRANVSVETLSKWRSLQENLSSMPIVRKVDPILLSDSKGLIQVTIAGSISQFTANLNSVGYILTEENDEIYISEK